MKTLVIAFIFGFTLFSCASKKNSQTNTATELTPVKSGTIAKSDSLFASIERSFCFGTCPAYKVEVYQSGYAIYTGKANVEKIGIYQGKLSKDQLKQLIANANEVGYFNLQDRYDLEGIMDIPSTTTSIVIDKKRKTVVKRYGYPNSIVEFEKNFDTLIQDVKWKKIGDLEH